MDQPRRMKMSGEEEGGGRYKDVSARDNRTAPSAMGCKDRGMLKAEGKLNIFQRSMRYLAV